MKRITFEIDQEKVLGLLGTFHNIREELRSLIIIAVLHNPSPSELAWLRVAGIEVVPEPKPAEERRTEPTVGYQCESCGYITQTVPCGCHEFQKA